MSGKSNPGQFFSLKRDKLPNHVAVIMDGNGRWAKSQKKPRVFGHRRGMETVRTVIRAADEVGIKVLSLYAFSEENWGRPRTEVNAIMALLNTYLLRERDELYERNVQLRVMGSLERLPPKTQKLIEDCQTLMADNTGLVVNVGLSYGGRSEIVSACREIARRVALGDIDCQDINAEMFSSALDTRGLPDPDLLIRTSGEMRISNFMLWQLAYSEIVFSPVHWPAFSRRDFEAALAEYQERQRRFGLLPGQLAEVLPVTSTMPTQISPSTSAGPSRC